MNVLGAVAAVLSLITAGCMFLVEVASLPWWVLFFLLVVFVVITIAAYAPDMSHQDSDGRTARWPGGERRG